MLLETNFNIYTQGLDNKQIKQLAGDTSKQMLFKMFQREYRRVVDKNNLVFVYHHIGYQKTTHNQRQATRVSITCEVYERI